MGQITLQGVAKRFGEVEVIPPLDLEIGEGEFVVFVGPSGCGKSTLLRLIAGLEDTSGGRIVIAGARICVCDEVVHALSYVPARSSRSHMLAILCGMPPVAVPRAAPVFGVVEAVDTDVAAAEVVVACIEVDGVGDGVVGARGTQCARLGRRGCGRLQPRRCA